MSGSREDHAMTCGNGGVRGVRRLAAALLVLAAPSAAADGGYTFRVAQGEAVESAIVVRNTCQSAHVFRVTAPGTPWVRFAEEVERLRVEGGSSRAVRLRFESAGLAPGVHRGKLVVDCIGCKSEQTFVEQVDEETTAVRVCNSERQSFPVEMTVLAAPRQGGGVTAPAGRPTNEIRNVEDAMRSRMADALARLAGKRGLSLLPRSLTVLSLPEGGLVAAAWLAGLDELPAARLAGGVEVMFLHLEPLEGTEAAGEYTLAVRIGEAPAAQLLDAGGAVARELAVSAEPSPGGATVYAARLTEDLTLPVWCAAAPTSPAAEGWTLWRGWPVRCLAARP